MLKDEFVLGGGGCLLCKRCCWCMLQVRLQRWCMPKLEAVQIWLSIWPHLQRHQWLPH